MSLTHANATRNTLANALAALCTAGSKLRFRDGGTTIVDIAMANPAWGGAVNGVITLLGVPLAANAVATGDVDNFQLLDGAAAVVVSGTVTATGGGGDITINNISVNAGQEASVLSLTYAAPV